MKMNTHRLVWLVLCAVAFSPAFASAQVSRVGNTKGVITPAGGLIIRGTDLAYDPVNNVYLVVGAQGRVYGVFTNTSGDVASGTSQFGIGSANASDAAYAAYPRAAYSPDLNNGQGGFLVTWHQFNGAANIIRAAIVTYPGTVIAETPLNIGGGTSYQEAGPTVAYSPTSQRFLVAWQTIPTYQIQARLVGLDGQPIGSIITIESGGSRDPSVAWNAATNEFGVIATSFNNSSGFVGFRRVAAATGALSARTTWGFSAATFITALTVNPATNHYIAAWSPGAAARYVELDQAGAVLAEGNVGVGSYDGLDLEYDVASGSILAVGNGQSNDVLGLELNGAGVPIGGLQTLSNGGGNVGSFYPRVAARTNAKQWGISFSRQFLAGAVQIVETATSLGGPVSDIRAAIESPAAGAVINGAFTVSGYAADRGATSGSGIDVVHIYTVRNGGTPQFAGAITSLSSRSDIGNTLGPQFTNSGYAIPISGLPDGSYQILVYPRSTVTGQFGAARSVSITISSSLPMMALDLPTHGSSVSANFTVSGWAINRFASSGTGVDAVHVWAFKTTGEQTLLGEATLGVSRPDIGAAFGSQFTSAGFSLSGTLAAGSYQIAAFMHDTATGTFSLARTANITVGASASSPLTYIDAPMTGNVSLGSTISGWAVDLGSSSGPGADVIHVWAFPVSGGAPVFVGFASVNGSRPDVASGLGNSRFTSSGYSLTLAGLQSGVTYDLQVFGRSTVTGQFTPRVVRITIN